MEKESLLDKLQEGFVDAKARAQENVCEEGTCDYWLGVAAAYSTLGQLVKGEIDSLVCVTSDMNPEEWEKVAQVAQDMDC